MFGETTEDRHKKKKKWFQSLSLISSDEEESDDDELNSKICMLTKVQNTNLRFPYPIFSDDSDEEIETYISNNQRLNCVSKRRSTSDLHSTNPKSRLNKYHKSSSKNDIGLLDNLSSGKHNKKFLPTSHCSKSKNSKFKFIRDENKRVWNYTKRRKKRPVFCRPETVFSTSEDEMEPCKKKKKSSHGKKASQVKLSSSDENLDKSTIKHKIESTDNPFYISRHFRKFIDSSCDSGDSELNEQKPTSIKKKKLCNSSYYLPSNNRSDNEPFRKPSTSREINSEIAKNREEKRVDHSISSSEEENKERMTLKNKTKHKTSPNPKRSIYTSNKHPFRNLITAQQLQEDNRKMKIGLKPTSQKVGKLVETPVAIQHPAPKKVNSLKKRNSDLPLKTDGPKMPSSHISKLQNLKRQFISSNKSSVELNKKLRNNMTLGTKGKETSRDMSKYKLNHSQKSPDDQEIIRNSNTEETTRDVDNDGNNINRKEARYTNVNVNVNVYCNSNQSDKSRSVEDLPEDHISNNSTGKESSTVDINFSVSREEESTKSPNKKVRISHRNRLKKLASNQQILCESNSESKLSKSNSLNRGSRSNETSNGDKPGQFDLVGNIISQMKINPYPCQKGRRKSLEQGTDGIGWFSNVSPSFSSHEASPMMSNSVFNPSKGPAQYQATHPSTASESLVVHGPSHNPFLNPIHKSLENQVYTASMKSLHSNSSNNENNNSPSTKTDKSFSSVSSLATAQKQIINEGVTPFYSANRNDYLNSPENPNTHLDNPKVGLDRSKNMEHLKPSAGDKSGVLEGRNCLKNSPESHCKFYNYSNSSTLKQKNDSANTNKTSKDGNSESGLSDVNSNNTQNSCINSMICQTNPYFVKEHHNSNEKKSTGVLGRNANNSNEQILPTMSYGSSCVSLEKNNNLETTNLQNRLNTLDSEVNAPKKGVRIRIQGNEFLYQKQRSSENSSLNSLKKPLTAQLPLSNLMEQNGLSHCTQEKICPSVENYQAEKGSLTNVGSDAIEDDEESLNSNSFSKETQNSSSSDSDEDSSSSDESSSSSSSTDSKNKTGDSDSSNSSSLKIKCTEDGGEIDHPVENPTPVQEKITNADLEVITLDSSSDEELHLSNPASTDNIANAGPSGFIAQNELGSVQLDLNSTNSQPVKSIFDPVTNSEPSTNFEREHDHTTYAAASTCTNVITNNQCLPSTANCFVGRIRVKSLQELGVDSEFFQSENALKDISEQSNTMQPQLNKLSSTTNGGDEETKVGERSVDISKLREPLRIKISKGNGENKKSLYKVQSCIQKPTNAMESQTNKLNITKKISNITNFDKTDNSKKLQTNENVSKPKPPSSSVSSEAAKLQSTSVVAENSLETLGNIFPQPVALRSKNSANIRFVKTGENTYRFVHQESSNSKTDQPTTSLSNNIMPSEPPNAQFKKPLPYLIALNIQSGAFTPIAHKVQTANQMHTVAVVQLPSNSSIDNSGNRSLLPLDDGQNSLACHGKTPISTIQEKSHEDPAVTSAMVTGTAAHSQIDKCQSQKNKINSNNSSSHELEEIFFKLCDELFTEVVCLKIPKMVDDLHLAIRQDEFKLGRLKTTEQLQSPETILAEKSRAERDFNEQIRILAHSFVPLFTTVVNKINKSNLKTLIIALYIRFVNQLKAIDSKYAKYHLTLRHIIKAMLQKSGYTHTDVCQILSDTDTSFTQNYSFIEKLLKKYDMYVEHRKKQIIVQQQISNKQVGSTKRQTDKRTAEPSPQQAKENSTRPNEESTCRIINKNTAISGSFSCSTTQPSSQKLPNPALPLPESSRSLVHTEPTRTICESSQDPPKNLDDLMFGEFFSTNI